MKLLAVETATEACSAALFLNGEIAERYQLAPREHNDLILPMIDSLLSDAGLSLNELDALAFGRGPGSFTGVRIAAGVMQGLAFGAGLPVAPVSTLAALAQEALDETPESFAFPCIDARMGEVYWGVYRRDENGLVKPAWAESVTGANDVDAPDDAVGHGLGSGWTTYEDALSERLGHARLTGVHFGRFPRARWIARLGAEIYLRGECVDAENAQPVYLRDKVAKKSGGLD